MQDKGLSLLVEGLLSGDNRSLTRLISLVEDDSPLLPELFRDIYPIKGHAHTIGICGPPGTGKSSLIDGLITLLRERGLNLGVISIDPSSPYSGGAFLGDRIRMQRHFLDESVLIRSMATRGHIGGLSHATRGAVRLMDASGKDVILIETVGVGQTEVEIAEIADTTILVLTPGLGDQIQVLKAGIMEIGDIFVVNKADQTGAERLVAEIDVMLGLNPNHEDLQAWIPSVVKTEAINQKGLEELWNTIESHLRHLKNNGILDEKRKALLVWETLELLSNRIRNRVLEKIMDGGSMDDLKEKICKMNMDPYTVVSNILDESGLKI